MESHSRSVRNQSRIERERQDVAMRPLLLSLTIALAAPAFGQTAGTASGAVTIDGRQVTLKYATAYVRDNYEKLLDKPRLMRILLSDREVGADSLRGVAMPSIYALAREGAVRGIMIELDPSNPQSINVTFLDKPSDPGRFMTSLSLCKTGAKLFKVWKQSATRVMGALDHEGQKSDDPDLARPGFSIEFDAPVIAESAVTADLKGAAAQKSPQIATLRARAAAIGKWDMVAIRSLCTKSALKSLESMPPEALAEMKKDAANQAAMQKKQLARAQKVIVRGDRAVVIISKNDFSTLVREGGRWKVE
jgi:hypothetical protein